MFLTLLLLPTADDFTPVTCGDYGCLYPNLCNAEAARWNETECCPAAAGDTLCSKLFVSMVFDDVLNDTFEYNREPFSNFCLCVYPLLVSSLLFKHDTIADEFLPVACGEKLCEYPNQCNADAAGFTTEECSALPPPVGGSICEVPSDDVACRKYNVLIISYLWGSIFVSHRNNLISITAIL